MENEKKDWEPDNISVLLGFLFGLVLAYIIINYPPFN